MHRCGQCGQEFDSENGYLTHFCPELGVTPQQPEAMGPNHEEISRAALERGAKQVQ
jgi:predicted  nucleic acid-binding Zn-ribbon protein